MGRESPYTANENADLGLDGACCAVAVASQKAGSSAKVESRMRRCMPDGGLIGFMFLSIFRLATTQLIARHNLFASGSARPPNAVAVGR